jgi:hypothetical protein
MPKQPEEREQKLDDVEELVEDAAEGLWLRFRDIVLIQRKLEGFVF